MTNRISAPGQGLNVPAYLYPTELYNAPYDVATNQLTLSPGDQLPIAAGDWLVSVGSVSMLQYLDPITGVWKGSNAFRGQYIPIRSDGFNYRLANLTGCVIAAEVTGGGSGYTQASTTAVSSAGGSTYQPIVGGQCSVATIPNPGAGYGVAPLLFIPAGPSPAANGVGSVPATGYCTISAGTVSGVTLTNVGAGYPSAPTALILPNPTDPNINTITQASVTLGLTSAGKIAAVLVTNPGAPVTTAPTITVSGTGGTGATVSAILLQTVTSASISAAGAGYGTSVEISTVGGQPSAGAFLNPAIELTGFRPRKASIGVTSTGGTLATVGTIYDGGLFAVGNAPTVLVNGNAVPTTVGTVLLTLGSVTDTVSLQQQ